MAMKELMTGLASLAIVGGALMIGAGTASAQYHHHHPGGSVSGDLSRVTIDAARLNRDYRQFERDAANGNVAREVADLRRIVRDEAHLARDLRQLNYDVNDGGYYNGGYSNQTVNSLIPCPTNPGYFYYPNNPGQLYYYPNQQAVQQQVTVSANPVSQSVMSTPANPVPQVLQTLRIANPESTGVELSFLFGGKSFSVESGTTKEFLVTSPTLIVFSRGGQMGDARYTLSGGSTFEFKYDNTGWSMVQKQREQLVTRTADPNLLPPNPLPRSAIQQAIPVAIQPSTFTAGSVTQAKNQN